MNSILLLPEMMVKIRQSIKSYSERIIKWERRHNIAYNAFINSLQRPELIRATLYVRKNRG